MVNLTALENITPFVLNSSIVNNSEQLIPNMINNANAQTNNWFGLILLTSIFLYLLFLSSNEKGFFRLDFVKALVFSSGITTSVGILLIITGITTSFTHVVWFNIIFTLSIISAWYLKQKGG